MFGLEPIMIYCERTSVGLFNEPLNVLSNAVFFIAAWFLWRHYEKTHKKYDEERMVLILLVVLIGIGSTLFHMIPNQITLYGDVIPIALFVAFSLYICLRRLVGLTIRETLLTIVLFGLVNALMGHVPQPYRFNESIGYFPCLIALAAIALRLQQKHHEAAGSFFKLTGLFTISLIFRSIDLKLCPSIAVGTHFLWHICNGLMVYLLAETIRERRSAGR